MLFFWWPRSELRHALIAHSAENVTSWARLNVRDVLDTLVVDATVAVNLVQTIALSRAEVWIFCIQAETCTAVPSRVANESGY